MIMKFSAAMCVYHKDDPLAFVEAFKSITEYQTITPNEVIIVVDGPIYGSLAETVSVYERSAHVRVIRLKDNCGHAVARQRAMEEATNDLIAIMDSDDISEPDRFEKQLAAFEKIPDVAVIGGQIKEFIGNTQNVVGVRIVPQNDLDIKQYLKSRCPMNLVTVMYKKSAVQDVGGFIDWFCEEDYYLWIRLSEAGYKFANLSNNLVNVRVGKEMYQRRGGWKYFKSEARLQIYMLKHGIIFFPRFLYNVCGRLVIQVLMPNRIRGLLFQKFFRQKVEINM